MIQFEPPKSDPGDLWSQVLRPVVFVALLIAFTDHSFAQEVPPSDEVIQIANDKIGACLSDVNPCVVTGDVLQNAFQLEMKSTEEEGTHSRRHRRRKKTKEISYQLLLMSEFQTPSKVPLSTTSQNQETLYAQDWASYFPRNSRLGLNRTAPWPVDPLIISSRAFSTSPDAQRSYFIEGLMEFASLSLMSEQSLVQNVVRAMNSFAQDDDEKMALLTLFSSRLYDNYNDKRNVFANTKRDPIAKGNITLNHLMAAVVYQLPDQGGVCNDIVKAVAQVGDKLFPDKDVLGIANGSHFGVLVHDKKKGNTIINWDLQTKAGGEPMLDPDMPVGNTRVFQIHNEKMVEIALLDTETGAVAKELLNAQTPTLMTGASPTVIFADFKRLVGMEKAARVQEAKVGTAETSHSKMIFFVAETSRLTEKESSNTGIMVAHEKINLGPNENISFAFHTGRQQNLIHFKAANVSVTASAGAELDAYATVRLAKDKSNEMNDIVPISASLNLNQKVEIKNIPQSAEAAQFQLEGQVMESAGSKDEGAREGALSDPSPMVAILNSVHYTGFYLNQVNASGALSVPLTDDLSSLSTIQYQGSNIGQKISAITGIEIMLTITHKSAYASAKF